MTICLVGFLIFWIININQRTLQFGIFRTMGLSLKKIIGMLIWEQVLSTALSIIAGIAIGDLTTRLFVPLFQLAYSGAEQVPPFKMLALATDYLKVYGVVGFMILLGTSILARIISRIDMAQAIKLGEE